MRKQLINFVIIAFASVCHAEQMWLPLLTAESQSNIIVSADPGHEKPCPLAYTNLIANTNLFSPAERELIREIPLKYGAVSTNVGPGGTVFKGVELRQWSIGGIGKPFPVSHFDYTNSESWVEVAFFRRHGLTIVCRTPFGDGYNARLSQGLVTAYQEYRNGKADGLYMGQLVDPMHCNYWARFKNGMIINKFLSWDYHGKIGMEAEFREPFDFIGNEAVRFDLSWEMPSMISTNATERTNNQ